MVLRLKWVHNPQAKSQKGIPATENFESLFSLVAPLATVELKDFTGVTPQGHPEMKLADHWQKT